MIDVGRALRWLGVLTVLGLLIWAAQESLTTIGAQTQIIAATRDSLRNVRREVAGVLATNARVADSNRTLTRVATALRADADSAGRRAAAFQREADRLRADRAARPPLGNVPASDSVTYYREQLAASDSENVELRASLDERKQEIAAKTEESATQQRQLTLLEAQVRADSIALADADHALGSADTVLGIVEPKCRIARVVPCPSRTVAFVGGAVIVVLAKQAIDQVRR